MEAFSSSKWIWAENNEKPNDHVFFYCDFKVNTVPGKAVLKIGAETKYYLYINGELAVFDGGLYRNSTPGCGYFDPVDITRYLKKGSNALALHVWYYGNGGRNNNYIPKAGVIFECRELGLFSNKNTLCYRNPAYTATGDPLPSYLYGGHNIGYDADKAVCLNESEAPDKSLLSPANEVGEYGSAPWNAIEKRPIPLFAFSGIKTAPYTKVGDVYTVTLPYAMQITPYFKIKAIKGLLIDVRSDRYEVNGGPGDSRNLYRGHRTEYNTRDGVQAFESLDWIFGEKIIFTIPDGAEVIELGYRVSGYDTEIKEFVTADERLNTLLKKCVRTLSCCMRENFMDCPDRERGQWIGDVSVQAPQVFYALGESAVKLLKKAANDFIRLRDGNRLIGNVPGENSGELPGQSLHAISMFGMLKEYYFGTRDKAFLKTAFEPCVEYLKLYETDKNGLIKPRAGDWEWYDHLYNVDVPLMRNAWYFSALEFAQFMADELGDRRFDEFLKARSQKLKANFENAFFKNGCYRSGDFCDDRGNALAVITGLAKKEHYPSLRDLLVSVSLASTYMEGYVLEALCMMDCKQDAYNRMMSRYHILIENENSTLWEDFNILGTKNHAWTGSPLTIVKKYFPELILKENNYPLVEK